MKKNRTIQVVNFPGVKRENIDFVYSESGSLDSVVSNSPGILKRHEVEKEVISQKGWKDGKIPNVTFVAREEDDIIFNLGENINYSLHQAHFKHVLEDEGGIVRAMNPLSTETLPITSDNHIVLFQRSMDLIHGPGLYNFASGYNADIYLGKIEDLVGEEVDTRDLWAFSLWKLNSELGITPEESSYDGMKILGFSKGFELSFDCQVNFAANLGIRTDDLMKRLSKGDFSQSSNFRVIKNDPNVLLELLDFVDSNRTYIDGKGYPLLVNPQTGKFGFTDDAYGTLIQHLGTFDPSKKESAIEILEKKGYTILDTDVTVPGAGVYLA
tara:strand:- start:1594 stop:2571 length:978 start_codon:yes stop_codon:yes gene_type:complete